MKYKIELVNIKEINHGDTILHNGELHTVDRSHFKYSEFMGLTLLGDSYNLGYKPVKKVHIIKSK